MNRKCCGIAVMAAALLISAPAAAQGPPLTLTPASPRLWDVSGDIGWFSSRRPDVAPTWDEWYDAAAASASLARYVTPHVRAELRVSVSGEGRTYQEERLPVPGQPFPAFRLREHYFQTASAGAGVYRQFFDNRWFHPFAGGGLDVERESHRTLTQEQLIGMPGRPPVFTPPQLMAPTVSYAARPFVATGFKWYVHERGFIRSDVKVSVGRHSNVQTTWSAGIGVDL
jgi:hypothetical protein